MNHPAPPSGSLPPPNFDRIARPYRWLEYLTLGRSLQHCREHFLPHLLHARQALVLGDGDGRFLARLLTRNPSLNADAVDLSASMLALLVTRCNAPKRLTTHHTDALTFTPGTVYDLVVTHFFLDCLTDPQLNTLTRRLAPSLSPEALWLVSDFRIPPGLLRLPARRLIRGLYLAFRLLTGLRPTHLPDHAAALTRIGLLPIAGHRSLGGLLTTELWQAPTPRSSIQSPCPTTPSSLPHPRPATPTQPQTLKPPLCPIPRITPSITSKPSTVAIPSPSSPPFQS